MGWSDEAIFSELKCLNKTMRSIDESLKILADRRDSISVQEYVEEKTGKLPAGYPSNNH